MPVSIDTTKAAVAAAALDAGAVDRQRRHRRPRRSRRSSTSSPRAGAGYVAMHMQGEPRTMQHEPRYDDVVAEVGDFLVERLDGRARGRHRAGALCADPGIGFGKRVDAQPRAARPARRARRARRGAGARRHVAQGVPRSVVADAIGAPTRSRPTRATTPRSPPRCGRSTTAPRSCGCTTCGRSPRRSAAVADAHARREAVA